MLTWTWKAFSDLSLGELYGLLALRQEVFVVEQRSIYQDVDGYDPGCHHLLGVEAGPEGPRLTAYLRVLPPGLKYPEASLGRVVIAPLGRGRGWGQQLVRQGLDFLATHHPGVPIRIGAQDYLRRFYSDFGFRAVSDVYDEDGIPHVDMVR
jgi:ElaA protein